MKYVHEIVSILKIRTSSNCTMEITTGVAGIMVMLWGPTTKGAHFHSDIWSISEGGVET